MTTFRYALVGDPTAGPSVQSDRVAWLTDDSLAYALNHPWQVQWVLGTPAPTRSQSARVRVDLPAHLLHAPRSLPGLLSGADRSDPAPALRLPPGLLQHAADVTFPGQGPFAPAARAAGRGAGRLTLRRSRVARWWNGTACGKPGNVTRVVFQVYASQSEAVSALLGDAVDFVPAITDPSLVARLAGDPAIHHQVIAPALNLQYLGCVLSPDSKPLARPEVRRAVAARVSVPGLLAAAGLEPAWEARNLLPPAMFGYDPTLRPPAPDGEAAPLPPALELLFNDREPVETALATALQAHLAPAVAVGLSGCPGYAQMVQAVRGGRGDLFLYGWHVKAPNPERILYPLFHSSGIPASNLTGYRGADRELDRLLLDPMDQARITAAVARILADLPVLGLYHATRLAAWRDRVRNLALRACDGQPADKLVTVRC